MYEELQTTTLWRRFSIPSDPGRAAETARLVYNLYVEQQVAADAPNNINALQSYWAISRVTVLQAS